MASVFTQDMSVKEVACDNPAVGCVLRHFGLACDDARSLGEASAEKALPVDLLLAALDRANVVAGEGPLDKMQIQGELRAVITGYIEGGFHNSLRADMTRLEKLLDEVIDAHSLEHGETLGSLRTVFMSFKSQMEEHLDIEEQILFPQLRKMGGRTQLFSSSPKPQSSLPHTALEEMQREHELVELAVAEMRELTGGFTCPAGESKQFAELYEGLASFQADLHKHICLENDLIWPMRLTEQAPAEAATPTEPAQEVSIAEGDEEFLCPRTDQPCETGSAALCKKFWDCVRSAMQQRWDNTGDEI